MSVFAMQKAKPCISPSPCNELWIYKYFNGFISHQPYMGFSSLRALLYHPVNLAGAYFCLGFHLLQNTFLE